ncbi:hypothetical protein [Gimesia sp.]|uniref:EF-Tu C-terminal domain-related protein n=1 Tax=Gimesia sp. TaxID=2024833 RepID=UPI000C4F6258|nr:hypothetical protein [Gimesia sp.]MAX40999.1 elongation factor Tu [Gimesia sp.]HAH45422.1 elongation factor Tu [Planctomycetaceae bacterium]HBL47950.1 elongation factor Tu [Planctomycetaceae bacterium]|tara:strand:- start:319 stop:627 length:309 start_codon:yes stop_codon:yes gene_type:complete
MIFREIEVEIRYLTTEEGGRQNGVFNGYRGQFHYNGGDYDGAQFFPELPEGVLLELGITVRAFVRFPQKRWDEFHSKNIRVGMEFLIREGARVVGEGTVKKL